MYDHDMLTKRELLTKHRNDESSMCTVVYVIVHVCIRGIEEWAMYIIDSPLPVTFSPELFHSSSRMCGSLVLTKLLHTRRAKKPYEGPSDRGR